MNNKERYNIPVFVANLNYRKDRKRHILLQFENKLEYNVTILSAYHYHEIGSYNLWLTFRKSVKYALDMNYDYFIFCEDDHSFTEYYSFDLFVNIIDKVVKYNPDVLLGGVSGFRSGIKVSDNLFWVDKFTGTQFVLIFKRFYNTILNAVFLPRADVLDQKICFLSDNKFVIYPFISIQQDFGYSDVTQQNSILGVVDRLFRNSERWFMVLDKIQSYYQDKMRSPVFQSKNIPSITLYTNQMLKYYKEGADGLIIRTLSLENVNFVWNMENIIDELKCGNSSAVIIQRKNIEKMDLSIINRLKKCICELCERVDIIVDDSAKYNFLVPISPDFFWIDSFEDSTFIVICKGAIDRLTKSSIQNEDIENILSKECFNKCIARISGNRELEKIKYMKRKYNNK